MGTSTRARTIAVHPRHIGMELEAQFGKRHGKQAVLLEAITATLSQQYFARQGILIQLDGLVAKYTDVLVRNVLQVQQVQIPQGLQIHSRRLGIANSREIMIQEITVHL